MNDRTAITFCVGLTAVALLAAGAGAHSLLAPPRPIACAIPIRGAMIATLVSTAGDPATLFHPINLTGAAQ